MCYCQYYTLHSTIVACGDDIPGYCIREWDWLGASGLSSDVKFECIYLFKDT